MSTIINNPPSGGSDDGSGIGLVIGVLLSIALIGLFIVYIWPAIQNGNTAKPQTTTEVKIQLPTSQSSQ